jgi:hypothetical protein
MANLKINPAEQIRYLLLTIILPLLYMHTKVFAMNGSVTSVIQVIYLFNSYSFTDMLLYIAQFIVVVIHDIFFTVLSSSFEVFCSNIQTLS